MWTNNGMSTLSLYKCNCWSPSLKTVGQWTNFIKRNAILRISSHRLQTNEKYSSYTQFTETEKQTDLKTLKYNYHHKNIWIIASWRYNIFNYYQFHHHDMQFSSVCTVFKMMTTALVIIVIPMSHAEISQKP